MNALEQEILNTQLALESGVKLETTVGDDGLTRSTVFIPEPKGFYADGEAPTMRELGVTGDPKKIAGAGVATLGGMAGGAATGLGGIFADLLAMGAGPQTQEAADELKAKYGTEALRGMLFEQIDALDIPEEYKFLAKDAAMVGEITGLPGVAAGAKQFPKVAGAVGEAVSDYAAGAPQRIADRTSGTMFGAGMDPTAPIDEAIVAGQKLMGKEPVADVSIIAAPETARAHKTPALLLVEGTGEKATTPVVQKFTKGKEDIALANINAALTNNPDAARSVEGWKKFTQETMGGDYLPHPPMVAIEYGRSPEKIAEKLRQLTPELKAGVDEGFAYVSDIRNIYQSGEADPAMTADLFVWGILSRGAGPVQQEAAFIDIMQDAAPMIQKVADGTFGEADMANWIDNMKKSLPEGSPGKQVTMNVNAAGKLLFELGKKPEGSNQTVLQIIHDMVSDPNVPAKEIRRKFMTLTESAGIDNKVVSFILLVSGRDDVLVMDRIQGRHLWDDGKFGGQNIYDGIGKGEGLNGIFKGPRGLLVTEALEDAMRPNIQQAYAMIGRPEDASLGRFHWESWVIEGEQVVSHSTLRAVSKRSPIGEGVTEGKTDEYASGFRYIRGQAGPVQRYPLSDGSFVYMTPEKAKEFLAFVKKPGSGIVPKGFKVTERADVPWYERAEVNREKLDDAARAYENATPEGEVL